MTKKFFWAKVICYDHFYPWETESSWRRKNACHSFEKKKQSKKVSSWLRKWKLCSDIYVQIDQDQWEGKCLKSKSRSKPRGKRLSWLTKINYHNYKKGIEMEKKNRESGSRTGRCVCVCVSVCLHRQLGWVDGVSISLSPSLLYLLSPFYFRFTNH